MGATTRDQPALCGRAWILVETSQFFIPPYPVSDKAFLIALKRWGRRSRGSYSDSFTKAICTDLGDPASPPPPSFFTRLIVGPKVEFWLANGEPQPEASRVQATARLTSEPVLQSPAYRFGPAAFPCPPPSICIVSMGGAGLPRSWTAGHLQNGLYHPFVPTSGSLRLHIKAFFPPPGHLLGWGATAALEVLPAQPRSSNSVCSDIRAPGRRKWKQINRGRALSVREVERRVWKWGWMLPFASGFRKRCNSEYWSVWKSSVRQIT